MREHHDQNEGGEGASSAPRVGDGPPSGPQASASPSQAASWPSWDRGACGLGGRRPSGPPPMDRALASQIPPCQRGRKALRSWSPSPTLACQAGAGWDRKGWAASLALRLPGCPCPGDRRRGPTDPLAGFPLSGEGTSTHFSKKGEASDLQTTSPSTQQSWSPKPCLSWLHLPLGPLSPCPLGGVLPASVLRIPLVLQGLGTRTSGSKQPGLPVPAVPLTALVTKPSLNCLSVRWSFVRPFDKYLQRPLPGARHCSGRWKPW